MKKRIWKEKCKNCQKRIPQKAKALLNLKTKEITCISCDNDCENK